MLLIIRKSGELRRILRLFEPRSGEGRISGRDEGVSDANDGSRRRNASGAAFPLKGGCREATEGWDVGLQKEHRASDALFVDQRVRESNLERLFVVMVSH